MLQNQIAEFKFWLASCVLFGKLPSSLWLSFLLCKDGVINDTYNLGFL